MFFLVIIVTYSTCDQHIIDTIHMSVKMFLKECFVAHSGGEQNISHTLHMSRVPKTTFGFITCLHTTDRVTQEVQWATPGVYLQLRIAHQQ